MPSDKVCALNVLIVNTEKTWRGGERQTLYHLQGLLQAGINVELLCRSNTPLEERARQLGITTHTLTQHLQVFCRLKPQRYHVLWAQSAKAQSLLVYTKFWHRRPILYTRRVDFVVHKPLSLWKYRHTDVIVAISQAIARILASKGINTTAVIPSIMQPKTLNRQRAQQLLKTHSLQNKRIIGTIAALVPHKDPYTLVEAIEKLTKIRQDIVLLHFGDGKLFNEIKQLIAQKKLQKHYYLLGHQPEVEDFFSIFEIFCMSSQEEGLGSSVLDAFYYQVPVVSTNAGGLKETVDGCGILCATGNSTALAKGISDLLNNPTHAKALTHQAKEKITHYSLENNTKAYLKILYKLASF